MPLFQPINPMVMNFKKAFFLLFYLFTLNGSRGQSFLMIKDPQIREIVPEEASIEKIADGFAFTEGPAWSKEGFLVFSDIPASKIYRWDPEGGLMVYLDPSGQANGLAFDQDGNVYCTGPGGVLIFNEEGIYLGLIRFPETPSNVCFGG